VIAAAVTLKWATTLIISTTTVFETVVINNGTPINTGPPVTSAQPSYAGAATTTYNTGFNPDIPTIWENGTVTGSGVEL
jgi:hypothetical protein